MSRLTTAVLAFFGGVLGLSVIYLTIRVYLIKRNEKNKKQKKSTGGWFGSSRGTYEQAEAGLNEVDTALSHRGRPGSVRFAASTNENESGNNNEQNNGANGTATAEGVNRNTSIRSIMTLPAYQPKPGDSEQVLGREGERDGIDVVVEMITAEEEENMREDEMRALYEVRLARRQEIADREERRRQRREARSRNDTAALAEIRTRTNAAQESTELDDLRQEHTRLRTERQRAASSVSYGDLGVARHDGSRLRANSQDSERHGLLSDAASIAASSTRTGAISPGIHNRAMSSGSIPTMDYEPPPPIGTRSRGSSRASTAQPGRNASSSRDRAGSSPEMVEADVGASGMRPLSPPGYDEVSLDDRSGANTPSYPPPDYSGPRAGPSSQRNSRIASEMNGLARGEQHSPTGSTGGNGSNHNLPQIVIEPSSRASTYGIS